MITFLLITIIDSRDKYNNTTLCALFKLKFILNRGRVWVHDKTEYILPPPNHEPNPPAYATVGSK